MQRIKSFQINHNVLEPGFYISREDGDVVTYDLRTRKPNAGDYMSNAVMHSVEHMFGCRCCGGRDGRRMTRMGCQTGFYLLVRDMDAKDVFELTKKILKQTIEHDGDVFGKSAIECGHYENLDIELAKEECRTYLEVLENQTNMEFTYPTE